MMGSSSLPLDEVLDVLERTPAVLDALLRGTDPAWHRPNEGPGTWSACEVVAHLVHGEETDWVPRARRIREHGERRVFPAVDREAHLRRYGTWALGDLLDRFAVLRRASLKEVRGWALAAPDLERRGRHPAFGPVTLGELLATWAAHDLGHVGQASRVMAKQLSGRVGPWRAYLGVLHR